MVRGTSTTTYGPDAAVTREDLITMLVRLMGWESQASGKTLPPNFSKPNSVAPYARANVAMAIEKACYRVKIWKTSGLLMLLSGAEVAVLR